MTLTRHQKSIEAREDPKWRGYTLDELRYQQAYTAARIEIERDRLKQMTHGMTERVHNFQHHNLLGRILTNFSYLDYTFLAFRVGRNLLRLLRRKR